MKRYTLLGIILIVTGLVYGVVKYTYAKKEASNALVSYNREIRPLLSDKCFSCHGPDVSKVKAGLRLDIPASAFGELEKNKGHFAIVPGQPDKSELIKRIASNDPAIMMPVPESHLTRLTTEEINLFKRWIEQGAKYEKHWAFVAPVKAKLPEVDHSSWVKNEIDPFILQKMEQKGFSPNDPATKETLIKRAYADILGIAPSFDELNRWNNVSSENWYAELIDQLLKKPAYGEKMALLWMDLARYSDSYGFQDDNIRSQWPWRDWVINAFNTNLSYDQFLTQQIAGDLMPNATKSNILATAFFRNHKYTEEGGVIEEEYRVSYNIDKTRTYGKAILGVTIECAQCHDHPLAREIKQAHYWGLVAAFNRGKNVEGGSTVSESAIGGFINFVNLKKQSQPAEVILLNGKVVPEARPGPDDKESDSDDKYVDPTTSPKVPKISRRAAFAEAATTDNPLLARAFVNRMWAALLGRGIVYPADEMNARNVPSHPQLLDWMAQDFISHGYDVRYFIRGVVLSQPYGFSTGTTPPELFAAAMERPLTGEQLARSWRVAAGLPPEDDALRHAVISALPEVLPKDYTVSFQQAQFLSGSIALDGLLKDRPETTVGRLGSLNESDARVRAAFSAVYGRLPETGELAEATRLMDQMGGTPLDKSRDLLWALMTSAEFLTLP